MGDKMENLKETLESLYKLQEKDVKIFELKENLVKLPKIIEEKKKQIVSVKRSVSVLRLKTSIAAKQSCQCFMCKHITFFL